MDEFYVQAKATFHVVLMNPDPHGSLLILVGWIRIQILGKMSQEKRKKLRNVIIELLNF
jgi:hypothetical protein